jgi:hypothetical protein
MKFSIDELFDCFLSFRTKGSWRYNLQVFQCEGCNGVDDGEKMTIKSFLHGTYSALVFCERYAVFSSDDSFASRKIILNSNPKNHHQHSLTLARATYDSFDTHHIQTSLVEYVIRRHRQAPSGLCTYSM